MEYGELGEELGGSPSSATATTTDSLTTYDPAECEFVQVRNIENYTNGQIWTW